VNLTCDELVDLMLDFVGEELPDDRVSAIKAHLCGCPPCGVVVQRYRFTIVMSRSLPKTEPLPPALESKLRASLGLNAEDRG
jgi:hypothetical protein